MSEYKGKEQSWIEEYTIYSFLIDGEYYGVKESGGHTTYVDVFGNELSNEQSRELAPLMVVTEKMRNEH